MCESSFATSDCYLRPYTSTASVATHAADYSSTLTSVLTTVTALAEAFGPSVPWFVWRSPSARKRLHLDVM